MLYTLNFHLSCDLPRCDGPDIEHFTRLLIIHISRACLYDVAENVNKGDIAAIRDNIQEEAMVFALGPSNYS